MKKYTHFIFKTVILYLALFSCVACFSPVIAWGPTGHRVVAQIAQNHLSRKAWRQLHLLMGSESLSMQANWADFIRADHRYDSMQSWHYQDFSANLNRTAFDQQLANTKGRHLYTQILALAEVLKNEQALREDRLFALRFIVHLIGDMHQPLHVGHSEDKGGNAIPVSWFGRETNLHHVWDEDLIEFQKLSYSEYAADLDRMAPAELEQIQKGTLADWLFDSYQAAHRVYASAQPNAKLGYRYNYDEVKLLNEQLLKGGLRLAAFLNGLFK